MKRILILSLFVLAIIGMAMVGCAGDTEKVETKEGGKKAAKVDKKADESGCEDGTGPKCDDKEKMKGDKKGSECDECEDKADCGEKHPKGCDCENYEEKPAEEKPVEEK